MNLSDDEIWELVKNLEGQTIFTYVEQERNHILKVEDTGKRTDRVIIQNRETTPIKGDIIAGVRLFLLQGTLERKTDLAFLSGPDKKTSSIVFSIIGKITENKSRYDNFRGPKLVLKKS